MKDNTYGIYNFRLILDNVPSITCEIEDALYEAGCDDGILGQVEGITFIEFDREAMSYEDAVLSAINDVNRSACSATVSRVGPFEIVSAPLIMERTGIKKQTLHHYINGERGPGDFPSPLYSAGKSKYFLWSDVVKWLKKNSDYTFKECADSEVNDAINGILATKKHVKTKKQLLEYWDSLK